MTDLDWRTQRKLGVCYYPEHWPEAQWEDDAAKMAQLGLTFVRIAEFAWSRIEPEEGRYDWTWLDRAIQVLGAQGLKVVLCTPTPTPPIWLTSKYPMVLRHDERGQPIKHGTRHHVSLGSKTYRQLSAKITTALAQRYGNNPHVAGWQTDNEFGCHDSTPSYGPEDLEAFRLWLAKRYGDIAALNQAWGTVFWSQEYSSFEQVDFPVMLQAQTNPAHDLAAKRFFSDMTVEFNAQQCDIIRQHSDDKWITHNFMVNETSFDHWKMSGDLDLASWDSYPLGFVEFFGQGFGVADDSVIERYMRIGHPDIVAFHHDLYRSVGHQRWWVMEQQPGPVNWATWNPSPVDGAVEFWSLEAFAHGAETVSYFRWRQAPWSQEQYHTGLNRWDGTPDRAFTEASEVSGLLNDLPQHSSDPQRTASLILDYDSVWHLEAAPQGETQVMMVKVFTWYHALRRAGLNVEVVPSAEQATSRLVINPFHHQLQIAQRPDQIVLNGPRSGTRGADAQMAHNPLAKVLRSESLRPTHSVDVMVGNTVVGAHSWVEHLEPDDGLELGQYFQAADQQTGLSAAWVAKDGTHYLAFEPDERGVVAILSKLIPAAGLVPTVVPEDLRLRWADDHLWAMNYGSQEIQVDQVTGMKLRPVVGSLALGGYSVGLYERG